MNKEGRVKATDAAVVRMSELLLCLMSGERKLVDIEETDSLCIANDGHTDYAKKMTIMWTEPIRSGGSATSQELYETFSKAMKDGS